EREPRAELFFKRWLGSREFINNIERWYLFLEDISPAELRSMPHILERVEAVREFRLKSRSKPTRALAAYPTRFHTTFKPSGNYIALPQVSSERRDYIPIAFLGPDVLCGDKLRLIDHADLFYFGVLNSRM